MKNILININIILLGLICSSCAHYISGQLIDSNGGVIVNQEARINIIHIKNGTNKFISVLKTNNKGKFSSSKNLPKGEYLIEALVPGYKIASKNIILEKSLNIILTLQPLTNSNLSPIFEIKDKEDPNKGIGNVNIMPPQL